MKILNFILIFLLLMSGFSFAYAVENQEHSESITKEQNAQRLFEESLKLLNPLTDKQILQYRDFSEKQDTAIAPAFPLLQTRTVRITLEPGNSPLKIFTTGNTVTALVFHDSTGSPWEITSLTNGSPEAFQILKPDIVEGNLINILPIKSNASSNIVVTLKDKDIPLILSLESDNIKASSRMADALVLIQLAHLGPKAAIPTLSRIEETVTSSMIAFLDQLPPEGSARIRVTTSLPNLNIWEYQEKFYVRTQDMLIYPPWVAVVHGASNIKCYEILPTKRLLISVNGQIQTVDTE